MNDKTPNKPQKQMGRLIAKCWADEAFKQNLIKNPAAALKAAGIEVPEGVEIKVVENTDALVHVIVPTSSTGELSDDELDNVSGGFGFIGWW